MPWLSVSFEVAANEVEAVADALLEAGAASVEVADADAGSSREQPVFAEPGSGDTRPWRCSVVSALVAEGTDAGALVTESCRRAGIAAPAYRLTPVADEDWVRASQNQFAPIRVSQR